MDWTSQHTKTKLTERAQGLNGRTYEVVSTGIPKPVRAYRKGGDGSDGRKAKRECIATVPTVELGILCAEQVERWARNADSGSDDAQRAQVAQQTRETLSASQARVEYLVTVPYAQMTVAQETLGNTGLHTTLMCRPAERYGPAAQPGHTLPRAALWRAVRQVNDDLVARGVEDRLGGDHPLNFHNEHHELERRLTRFLQDHYRWDADGEIEPFVDPLPPRTATSGTETLANHPSAGILTIE